MEQEQKSQKAKALAHMIMDGYEFMQAIANTTVGTPIDISSIEKKREEERKLDDEINMKIRQDIENDVRRFPRRMCSIVYPTAPPLNPRKRGPLYHSRDIKQMRLIKTLPPLPSKEKIEKTINILYDAFYFKWFFRRDAIRQAKNLIVVRQQMKQMQDMMTAFKIERGYTVEKKPKRPNHHRINKRKR